MRPDEHHPAYRAGRLVQWGLRLRARPVQTPEYQALIDAYFDDPAFRDAVHAVAAGLGLVVLDVSEHGVVLSPSDESVFALKPSQFRPTSSGADQRLVDGLVTVIVHVVARLFGLRVCARQGVVTVSGSFHVVGRRRAGYFGRALLTPFIAVLVQVPDGGARLDRWRVAETTRDGNGPECHEGV